MAGMNTYNAEMVQDLVKYDQLTVVVLDGIVYNVTEFMAKHPGGADVLRRRNGCDATEAFNSVGHSSYARDLMRKYALGAFQPDAPTTATDGATGEEKLALLPEIAENGETAANTNPSGAASRWHAQRRKRMVHEHPEVLAYVGYFQGSLAVGIVATVVHLICSFYARSTTWFHVFLMAYTIGAFCKMAQFAMAHEVAHNLVHPKLEQKWLWKDLALRAVTLPCTSNMLYEYYHNHHIAHHRLLGEQGIYDALASVSVNAQNGDGDVLAPQNFLVKQLLRAEGVQRKLASITLDQLPKYLSGDNKVAVFINKTAVDRVWLLKLIWDPLFHTLHFGLMTVYSALINTACLVGFLAGKAAQVDRLQPLERLVRRVMGINDRRARELYKSSVLLWPSAAVGIHFLTWLVMLVLFCKLPFGGSAMKQLWYLALSDMFLFGFLFHPFLSYFLAVHHSKPGVPDGIAGRQCQPTHSVYDTFLSIVCFNLNYHVEHHDMPTVPWVNLPKVHDAAPEMYADLHSYSAWYDVIWGYLKDPYTFAYACSCDGPLSAVDPSSLEQGRAEPPESST